MAPDTAATESHRLVVLGPDAGVVLERGNAKIPLTWDEATDPAWSLIDLNTERVSD